MLRFAALQHSSSTHIAVNLPIAALPLHFFCPPICRIVHSGYQHFYKYVHNVHTHCDLSNIPGSHDYGSFLVPLCDFFSFRFANFKVGKINFKVGKINIKVGKINFKVGKINFNFNVDKINFLMSEKSTLKLVKSTLKFEKSTLMSTKSTLKLVKSTLKLVK